MSAPLNTVYLDHNSTSALKPEVLATMLPWLQQQHGNPTSRHVFGRNARDAVEHARSQVAQAVGVQASQVIFTASGTEANNFSISGITGYETPTQVLTSSLEHPCVSRPAQALQARGWQMQSIRATQTGLIDLSHLASLLKTPTHLVSVMLANNETGAIQPIAEVSKLAKQSGAYLHTDAVQAFGKIPVHFNDLGVNAMTLSSHKIGGPLGAGALILDKRIDMQPLLYGGGQEKGLRSGTENIAAIVGFGAACALAVAELALFEHHTRQLRDRFEAGLTRLPARFFGKQVARLPNTSFFAIASQQAVIEGETLVTALDKAGFAVASGSACSSDSSEPSHVLLAMGVPPDIARGAIRMSFSQRNTMAQVDACLSALTQQVARLSAMTAVAA